MRNSNSALVVVIALGLACFTSCLKKTYDGPPDTSAFDPQLDVNLTIEKLKSRYNGSLAQIIDSDFTISGIVTADDRSGNFYKQIVVEDGTGAILLNIDANNLYTRYPIGRKIYVRLKGLYYGHSAKLPLLGSVPDYTGEVGRIPGAGIDSHIVRANYPNELPATRFSSLSGLTTLNEGMLNRLIQIENIQVVSEDTAKTFALQPSVSSATNITLEDCDGNKIVLRTSGYASFQNIKLPKGKGTIKGIYSTFNNIPQLLIRDTSDIRFIAERCPAGGTNPAVTPLISLDSLRNLYVGAGVKLGPCKISGVVISDAANKNVTAGSAVLQDGSKGIVVYWGGTVTYSMGDSLLLDVTGDSLIMYQGALELKRTPGATKPAPIVVGRAVAPRELTIAQLNAAFSDYESTLVRIVNASVMGGGTYSGSKTLTDGTGNIVLYTSPAALFSSQPVPAFPKTYVGIVTPFTGTVTRELKLRNPDVDVY